MKQNLDEDKLNDCSHASRKEEGENIGRGRGRGGKERGRVRGREDWI
jgi:hypothetical protein